MVICCFIFVKSFLTAMTRKGLYNEQSWKWQKDKGTSRDSPLGWHTFLGHRLLSSCAEQLKSWDYSSVSILLQLSHPRQALLNYSGAHLGFTRHLLTCVSLGRLCNERRHGAMKWRKVSATLKTAAGFIWESETEEGKKIKNLQGFITQRLKQKLKKNIY